MKWFFLTLFDDAFKVSPSFIYRYCIAFCNLKKTPQSIQTDKFPDRDFIKSEKSLQPSVKTHPPTHPPTVGKKNYTGKQESTNV